MRDPKGKPVKAWAGDYEETPFFFEERRGNENRLVGWSEEPAQTKQAFYAILEHLPDETDVLLKIVTRREPSGKTLYSRFHRTVEKRLVAHVVGQNEGYIFGDGMHQICVKDPESDYYLAFDEHGILFIYSPTTKDSETFQSLGFQERQAEVIYSRPHYHTTPSNSEILEAKFIRELGLVEVD